MTKLKTYMRFLKSQLSIILFYIAVSAILTVATLLNRGDFYILRIYILSSLTIFLILMCYRFFVFEEEERRRVQNESVKEKLEDDMEMMRRSEEDMNEYFLTWVHQIKIPITASKMILDKWGEVTAENREELRRCVLSIDGYTNMALGYLKVLGNEPDLYFIRTSIDSIINPVIKNYSSVFISKHITLKYEKINDIVVTDVKWCRLMFEQILGNSLKYTEKGYISIEYDERERRLMIKDSGIGIDGADLPNIFHLGYSGKNGSFNDMSTGIGLFIVNKISHRINVNVEISSQKGEGTQVGLTFPKKY